MRIDRSLLNKTQVAGEREWSLQIGKWIDQGVGPIAVNNFLVDVLQKEINKGRMTQPNAESLRKAVHAAYKSINSARGQFDKNKLAQYAQWDNVAQTSQSSIHVAALNFFETKLGFSGKRIESEWKLYLQYRSGQDLPLPKTPGGDSYADENEYFASLVSQGVTSASQVMFDLQSEGWLYGRQGDMQATMSRFDEYVANMGAASPTSENATAPLMLGNVHRVVQEYKNKQAALGRKATSKTIARRLQSVFQLSKKEAQKLYNFYSTNIGSNANNPAFSPGDAGFYSQPEQLETSDFRPARSNLDPAVFGEIAREYSSILAKGLNPLAKTRFGDEFTDALVSRFGIDHGQADIAKQFFFSRYNKMQGKEKADWDAFVANPSAVANPDQNLSGWYAVSRNMERTAIPKQSMANPTPYRGVATDREGYASIADTENILDYATLGEDPASEKRYEPSRNRSQGFFEWFLGRRRHASNDYIGEMAKKLGYQVNRRWLADVRKKMDIEEDPQKQREMTALYRARDFLAEDSMQRRQRLGEINAEGKLPGSKPVAASLLERLLPTSDYHREGRAVKKELAEKKEELEATRKTFAGTSDPVRREKLQDEISKLTNAISDLTRRYEQYDQGYRPQKSLEEQEKLAVEAAQKVVQEIESRYDSSGKLIADKPLSAEAARFVNSRDTERFEESVFTNANQKTKAEIANDRRREARLQRIEMMTDKGATYGRSIGEAVGGRGSKIAGFGEKLGGVLGKVAGKFLVVVEAARLVGKAFKKIYAAAKENVDKMLEFAKYNGLLGAASSRHQGRETVRNIRYARATAKSGSKLISAWDDLEDELTPVRTLWQNIKNGLLTPMVKFLTLCMKGVNAVGRFFKLIGKGISSIISFLNPFSAFRTSGSLDGQATATGDGGYNRPEAKEGYGRMENLGTRDYSRKIRNNEGEGGTILVSEGVGEAPVGWENRTDLERNLDAQIGIVNGKVTEDNKKFNATVNAFQSSEEMFADVRKKAEKQAKKEGKDVQEAGDEAVGAKFKELEKNQRFLGLMEAEYEEELSAAKSEDWSGFNAGVTPGVASNANSDRVSKKYQEQKDFALSYGLDKNATYYTRIGELYKKQDAGEEISDEDIARATGAKGKKEIETMRGQIDKWRENGDYKEIMAYSGRQNALRTGEDTSKFDEILKTAQNSLIVQQLQAERIRKVAEDSGEIQADVKKIAKKEQKETTDLMRDVMLKMANAYAVSEGADRSNQGQEPQYGRFAGRPTVENWGL